MQIQNSEGKKSELEDVNLHFSDDSEKFWIVS